MNLYHILFGILLTAGLAVGVYAVGPETFMDEARSFAGIEETAPAFVRPPVTAEETPQAPPVVPAEATPEPAPSDPTGDYLLGQTKALAQAAIDYQIEAAKPIPNSDKIQEYFGAPVREMAEPNPLYRWEVVPGYTSEFSGAFTAEATLPVGTQCYGYNTPPCEEDYTPYRTSIEVSQDGMVSGSWEINTELMGSALCGVTVTAFYDVYYDGEYASTEPVSFEFMCEYDDPYYNGPEATETFSITDPWGSPYWPGLPQEHPWRR